MKRTRLTPAEAGTRALFGKVYHWHLHDGVLVLTPGVDGECHRELFGLPEKFAGSCYG